MKVANSLNSNTFVVDVVIHHHELSWNRYASGNGVSQIDLDLDG